MNNIMDITVYEEIEQIKALIAALEEYCTKLTQKVINVPMQEIEDARHAGLPAEYAMQYEGYYSHNVATAQNMINNIKEFHIPYWQAVIAKLQERL